MKPKLCLPPPGIANGEHSRPLSDTFAVGALVHYRCKHGFSLIGNKSVRCTAHGVWSHPLPRCEVLHCSKPADIAHGSLSGLAKAFFTPGTAVSYICEPGFSLIGTASIYCTQSGAWSRPPPVCQGVNFFPFPFLPFLLSVSKLSLMDGLWITHEPDHSLLGKCLSICDWAAHREGQSSGKPD
uniref:Sushi domain-containing protein n=1 Tax=Bubo bubo TaxID=30461 RepID=A0A8C0IB78_BUBBB